MVYRKSKCSLSQSSFIIVTQENVVVTVYTTNLTFNNSTFCPHTVFMCFVWIWEQTAIISLYNINWLDFITETECVYCAVRGQPVSIIQFNPRIRIIGTQAICLIRFSSCTNQNAFPGGKYGRCLRLTTYHHPVPLSRNLGDVTSWNPLGLSRPVMGLLYLYLYLELFTIQLLEKCFIRNHSLIYFMTFIIQQ